MHHPCKRCFVGKHNAVHLLLISWVSIAPDLALAQASPFMTGATVFGMAMFGTLFLMTQFLQSVLGYSTVKAGAVAEATRASPVPRIKRRASTKTENRGRNLLCGWS